MKVIIEGVKDKDFLPHFFDDPSTAIALKQVVRRNLALRPEDTVEIVVKEK